MNKFFDFLVLLIFFCIFMVKPPIGMLLLFPYIYLIFHKEEERRRNAIEELQNILMNGESIVSLGVEVRAFAIFSRRSLIAITNSRVIYFRRPILGGFDMLDVQWKEITDSRMSQNIIPNIFGSKLSFIHSLKKDNIHISISNEIAKEIYSYSQKEEQEWEEKRRLRTIEEKRASAGGTYITTPTAPSPIQSTTEGISVLDEIKKVKEMLDNGIISDVEFNSNSRSCYFPMKIS